MDKQQKRFYYSFNAAENTHQLAARLAIAENTSIREIVKRALEAYARNTGLPEAPKLEVRA